MRDTSQLYKGVGSLESGLSSVWDNSSPWETAAGRHYEAPDVALCSRVCWKKDMLWLAHRECRGEQTHRVGSCTSVVKWKTLFDYPNTTYFRMTDRGWHDGFIGSCGYSVHPLQSENYSNSRRPRTRTGWWPSLAWAGFALKNDFMKGRKVFSRYLEWYGRRMEMFWSQEVDRERKWVTPTPLFYKTCL